MISFKDRLRVAWDIMKTGFPKAWYHQKALPFAWPAWKQGVPEWHLINLQSYIDEGFTMNSLVYSAIMFKVRAVVPAPLRAFTGDPEFPDPQHPNHALSKLIARPNEHQSWSEFQAQAQVYLNLDGNAFIFKDHIHRQMYALRPDRVYVVPSEGKPATIMGYRYVPEGCSWRDGLPILPEDMMHIKLPYPGDPLEGMGYGLSPLAPGSQVTDVDNMVTEFLNLFFKRGSMLTGVLKFNQPLTDDIADTILERWKSKYGGYKKWETGILDRGGEYERTGLTFEEMGFKEIDARNESRILGPFGVPPILIGAKVGLDRSTYSNYEGARKAVWEDTLVPELALFEAEYKYHLRGRNTFVQFDTSNVPALQKDIPVQANAAFTLWQMGVPAYRALRISGLRLGRFEGDDIPWGDSKQPASNDQGPRADDEDDSWGMRSLVKPGAAPKSSFVSQLKCDNCGGPLDEAGASSGSNGDGVKLICKYCRQPYTIRPAFEYVE